MCIRPRRKMRQKALMSFWKFMAAADSTALIALPALPFSRLRSKEPLIKPAFLRTESDHGNSPAGFLSVVEKRR